MAPLSLSASRCSQLVPRMVLQVECAHQDLAGTRHSLQGPSGFRERSLRSTAVSKLVPIQVKIVARLEALAMVG